MRFLRHDGIYRSDVSSLPVNPARLPPPVGRPRCRAIGRDGRITPCPSSAMSSGRLFLDRGGRHQSPSPLRRHPQNKSLAFRRASLYHRTVSSVLTVCVSSGDKRTGSLPSPSARLYMRAFIAPSDGGGSVNSLRDLPVPMLCQRTSKLRTARWPPIRRANQRRWSGPKG